MLCAWLMFESVGEDMLKTDAVFRCGELFENDEGVAGLIQVTVG